MASAAALETVALTPLCQVLLCEQGAVAAGMRVLLSVRPGVLAEVLSQGGKEERAGVVPDATAFDGTNSIPASCCAELQKQGSGQSCWASRMRREGPRRGILPKGSYRSQPRLPSIEGAGRGGDAARGLEKRPVEQGEAQCSGAQGHGSGGSGQQCRSFTGAKTRVQNGDTGFSRGEATARTHAAGAAGSQPWSQGRRAAPASHPPRPGQGPGCPAPSAPVCGGPSLVAGHGQRG